MLGVEVETCDVVQPVKTKVHSLLLDNDLFDAEDSDSGMDYTARSPTPPLEECASSALDGPASPSHDEETPQQDEDDTFNDPEEAMNEEENGVDTQMSKSPGHRNNEAKSSIAKSRGRRVQKTDVKKIHSESQRIIRDSGVSLPYHKPKPMTLNDFFSRKPSKAKVPSVKSLKGLPKRQQIACLTQQTADLSQALSSSKQQSPLSEGTNTHSTLQEQSLDSSEEDVTAPPSKDEVGTDGNSPLDSQTDLHLALEDSSESSSAEDKVDALTDEVADKETKQEEALSSDDTDTSFTEDTLGRTAASPDTTSHLQEVQNRGGDENQSLNEDDIKDGIHQQAGTLQTPAKQESEGSVLHLSSPAEDGHVTPSQVRASQPASSSSQSYRQKLLEASLSKVKTLTPRLSGLADSFIDLDAEAEFGTPPSNPGLNRLMERFVKHTAKSAPRPRADVKLSVVTKETGGDGKEDLKLETVAVTIEGEEKEDPSLSVPGAKLLKLKEALQIKMQARREVERRRRKEAYRLDNEDYNEEDEGEMTDKSETDDDDDDILGESSKEKKIKTNQFINREAVDDDDDEDYKPGQDSGDDDNEDDTDGDSSDEDGDEDADEDADKEPEEGAAETKIYLTDTDEEDEEEANIKRTAAKARKKKKLVLQDDDEEGEDNAGQGEMVTASTLELHLDADDEEDEIGEKTTNQGSPRTKNLDPIRSSVGRLFLESVSSLEGTTDSSDVDKLGESLVGGALSSAKKGLALEEKTRDLFESASNTDGGTTGSSEMDRTSESLTGRTSFNWSAVRKNEGITPEDSGRDLPRLLDNSSNSLDNSFEMMGSMIPAHQPGGGIRRHSRKVSHEGAGDGFTPFSKHQFLLNAIPKSSSKLSELTLPVEDSQDLFRVDTPSLTVAMETQQGAETQSFRFSYEDEETQTQFLDENGFLKLRSTTKLKPSNKKLFSNENDSQDHLDELLGLCSGKFTSGTESSSKIRKGLFSQLNTQRVIEGTQDNMDELLGLCSGTFGVPKEDPKTILPVLDDNDADNRSESSFHILSDDEGNHGNRGNMEGAVLSDDEGSSRPTKKRKRIRMMDDEDSDDEAKDGDDDDVGEEDEEEVFDSEDELSFLVQQEEQGKKTLPKKSERTKIQNKVSRDFFEQEAELSGSEYGSDEDYDADDVPDELEQEAADMENVGTEDQLREQVNKVHMKTMDDDDARRLRLYKEMYLPDGDLYSDGKGRTRQFRWRHIDDDSQMNLFPGNSDDEGGEDHDEDTQWRMERFQREQWLNEQKEKETVKDAVNTDHVEDESSQFDILMKTAINRKKKVPMNVSGGIQDQNTENDKRIATPKSVKFRHGSFLKRSKGDLAKMASMIKPLTGNPTASRASRNVLYQSITPQVEEEDKKPQLQRSVTESPASQAPKAKKPRLERSQSLARSNSIFSHM